MDTIQAEECSRVLREYIAGRAKEGRDPPDFLEWILKASKDAAGYRILTHVPKLAHSGARDVPGVLYSPDDARRSFLRTCGIGTHSLPDRLVSPPVEKRNFVPVSGGAGITYLRSFLLLEMAGKKLVEHAIAAEDAFCAVLGNGDLKLGRKIAKSFADVVQDVSSSGALHPTLAQLYVSRNGGVEDADFDLFAPIPSDLLIEGLFQEFSRVTYSEENKVARKNYKDDKSDEEGSVFSRFLVSEARPFVCLSLGGAQPQNISYFNLLRNGRQYLFPSLPPQAWIASRAPDPAGVDSFVRLLMNSRMMFAAVRELGLFLKEDPAPVLATRRRRKSLEGEIVAAVVSFTHDMREGLGEGWSAKGVYSLTIYELAWLDSGFTPQSEQEQSLVSDWPSKIAKVISQSINESLGRMGLSGLGDEEMTNWMSRILEDLSWQDHVPVRKVVAS